MVEVKKKDSEFCKTCPSWICEGCWNIVNEFTVGEKVKVKRSVKQLEWNLFKERVGEVGTVTIVELDYEYPYTIEFDDGVELMFREDELERV